MEATLYFSVDGGSVEVRLSGNVDANSVIEVYRRIREGLPMPEPEDFGSIFNLPPDLIMGDERESDQAAQVVGARSPLLVEKPDDGDVREGHLAEAVDPEAREAWLNDAAQHPGASPSDRR